MRGLREQIVSSIASMPGFHSGTWLTGGEDGLGLSLTVWDTVKQASTLAGRFAVGSSPAGGSSVTRCETREVAVTA
jgi:hypothetical protein